MIKKLIKNSSIIFLVSILLFSLTGCQPNNESEKVLKTKVGEEIKYLEAELLDMLSTLNNISYSNFKVLPQKTNDETTENSENSGSTSSSEKDKASSGGDEKDKASSEESSKANEETGKSSNSEESATIYQVVPNGVITGNRDTDWENSKNTIEEIYTSWSTIIVDLYKLKISNTDILAFSNTLDTVTKHIKAEDKNNTLASLATLYSYLPKYLESYSDNTIEINLLYTKSNVLNAYSMVEQERWTDISTALAKADEYLMLVVNDATSVKTMEYNINRAYILLKELESSIKEEDKDIFYIKYKNLIEELNVINT